MRNMLTTGCNGAPGIMALASCICWANMAMFFCWIKLLRPFISNCVFKCGGGWRYLQFSLEQRPWKTKVENITFFKKRIKSAYIKNNNTNLPLESITISLSHNILSILFYNTFIIHLSALKNWGLMTLDNDLKLEVAILF